MGSGSSLHSDHGSSSGKGKTNNGIRKQMKKEFGADEQQHNEEEVQNNENVVKNDTSINPAIFKARKLFMKPIIKGRPLQQQVVIKKQNNGALLRELYRRMDPSLNMFSMRSVVGELEIAVKYKHSDRYLLVKIGRGKGLHQEDMCFPSPYVTVDLFLKSNPSNALTHKTRIKNSTSNPIFEEVLMFPLNDESIANSNVKVSVWDHMDGNKEDFLGETMIELCKLNLNSGNLLWYKLKQKTDTTITGDLDLTLTFDQSVHQLKVVVHDAHGLKITDVDDNTTCSFARVYITGIPSKQDSQVIAGTLDPVWEETFEFDVHADEFSRRIVVINILGENKHGGKPIALGDVHIPLANMASGEWGARKSYALQDLQNAPYVRSKWSEEGISMEFKEAMKAHAIYGYPKFLFKDQHKGKMLVSCYSKKARTQAKMVITNGAPAYDELQT